MKITKVQQSRVGQIDFNNLGFGNFFTDHMYVCDYTNGSWSEGNIQPYAPITLSPAAKVFHYGQAVFEGMKAYKNEVGDVFLFRPDENQKRINVSAVRLKMPEFPAYMFMQGLTELVKLDRDWVPTQQGCSLYIRPFMIATEDTIMANWSNAYKFMILCSPVGAYYPKPVRVKIAEKYSRAADGGVGFAKAAGNYSASFYPMAQTVDQGYDQIIWTDQSHTYVEEAGTMNLFFRIGDKLITPPTSERILDGVTRKSLIQLAKDKGIEVEVRPIAIDELVAVHSQGTLLEAFGSGTAAIISPICLLSHKGRDYELPKVENSYAQMLRKCMLDIQMRQAEDPYGWSVKVN